MPAQNLPGTDAAQHGSGDADLSIMLLSHRAFRRDLTGLARAAAATDLSDPARRRSVLAGWKTFKRQLHAHHTVEDELIWPALRSRLTDSPSALSVLEAMEEEHKRVEPLLAAVDGAFGESGPFDRLADITDTLTSTLSEHLAHEEKDALPLIGVALTAAEWRSAGRRMALKNGLSVNAELFPWMVDDDAPADRASAALGTLPPPVRVVYRAIWRPRYDRTSRW